ncbi:MAG: hypothetical protein LBK06_10785 [Planctomycetaceae bacterium]|nr:hypothetical protein [Planctomycetaceae bacterium]
MFFLLSLPLWIRILFLSLLAILIIMLLRLIFGLPSPRKATNPFLPCINPPLPLTDNHSLLPYEKNRVDVFKQELMSLEWRELCVMSICAVKRVLPIWDKEIKFNYFRYADRVVGVRHKISKKVIGNYISFLENNPNLWGSNDVKNEDIIELWVALTDYEFSISVKAAYILVSADALMLGFMFKDRPDYFIETFEYLFPVLGNNWNSFESFLTSVKADAKYFF